ncbi:phage holin family protein [Candidatus Saccharibacteria bacterium]|nr:phage holin family protein [Candidatus Saccharibacteria bacterium]MBI3338359.1 phage holin family protein [Candidatus Saccharibacteria bacterium]
MKRKPLVSFLLRWFVCSLGLWIAAGIVGGGINYDSRLTVIVVAGLILALVNIVIKPILVILSLPAILFSLGFFMLIINGFMVMLVSKLYSQLQVTNFWAAMLAGMIIGLVNYLVSTILEEK